MTATAEAPVEPIEGQEDEDTDGTVPAGPAGPAMPPEEIIVEGTQQLGMFDPGGKQATHAVLSIKGFTGIKLAGNTTYTNGQFLRGEFVARIEEEGDKHKMDRKNVIAVDCVRKLGAHVYDLRILGVVEAAVLEESDAQGALKRAVAALREQGVSDEGIAGIAGLPVVGDS